MPIQSHNIIDNTVRNGIRTGVIDLINSDGKVYRLRRRYPESDNMQQRLAELYAETNKKLGEHEAESHAELIKGGSLPTPTESDQQTYDRYVLRLLMKSNAPNELVGAIPWFNALAARAGANATERAIYLNLTSEQYTKAINRFQNIQAIATELQADSAYRLEGV